MVFFWKLVLKPLGGMFGIYELLPAFVFSVIVIVAVSLLTAEPDAQIEAEFDKVKGGQGTAIRNFSRRRAAAGFSVLFPKKLLPNGGCCAKMHLISGKSEDRAVLSDRAGTERAGFAGSRLPVGLQGFLS